MSVLHRKELEESPLADLHAIAAELGIESYRALRRDDLIAAILDANDDKGGNDGRGDKGGNGADAAKPAEREGETTGEISDEAEREQAADEATEKEAEEEAQAEAEPAAPEEVATGVLDVLPNGSGFLRRDDGPDIYVSAAQIRRCELRAGDEVGGPLRPPRRNERHPSLVRVESVDGQPAEPPPERPRFEDLTPVHPSERLDAPAALGPVAIGKGSRVAIAGPPGAGSTRLLAETVAKLAGGSGDLAISVVLAGARPEEVTGWRRDASLPVHGGSFDLAADELARAAELAIERAKRVVERGGDAVVAIDALDAFEPALARRLLGAARDVEGGGSLTVLAAVGDAWEHLRLASTRVVLEPVADGEPKVSAERSSTQRADLLQ